jgi:CHAT domain-containing protein/tetratricopeptide (TPR) repeat protein
MTQQGNDDPLTASEGALGDALSELIEVSSLEQFQALITCRPELLDDGFSEMLDAIAAHDGCGINLRRHQRLIAAARVNPEGAWRRFSEELSAANRTGKELEPVIEAIEAALGAERYAEAIALAEEALPRARAAELGILVAVLEAQRAGAYLQITEGDRAVAIEEAIGGFQRALAGTMEQEDAASILGQLAIAFAERPTGDPAEHTELSIAALRDALALVEDSNGEEPRDTIRLNLAHGLLRRERGDRRENLREGVDLCHAILSGRAPERDGPIWGRAQMNLAALLGELEANGEQLSAEDSADAAYLSVIDARGYVPDWQVGMAHFSRGRRARIAAEGSNEEHAEVALSDPTPEEIAAREEQRLALLEEARAQLEAARELSTEDPDPMRVGRIYRELADVLDQLGETADAIPVARRAAELLPLERGPRESVTAARHLGHLLAMNGEDWEEAADVFRAAVAASDLIFHGRLEGGDRESEARATGNLPRWAAFAIAAAGEPLEAMAVLEGGRTREMRARLGLSVTEADQLDGLPSDLRNAYAEALADLLSSPLREAGSAATRRVQEALTAIREVEGYEGFGMKVGAEDLVGAVEPGWPLLYVNPTPYGTLLLALRSEDGEPKAERLILETPTALELFMRLLAGEAAIRPDLLDSMEWGSYLAGVMGVTPEDRNAEVDIESVLPWLGEALARPIADFLSELGAEGVTLVPCGPIALAPLHAAYWEVEGIHRCLLDFFNVRYAPSGVLGATCLRRAVDRAAAPLSLIALAEEGLEAAIPEVEEIYKMFPSEQRLGAHGDEASVAFLHEHGAAATHLHFACHASAGTWGQNETGIQLGDGFLPAVQLTELGELRARVVSVSACQSAVLDLGDLSEEYFSIGGAMIAGGAACAIATLWPVRDDCAALLMTRLYEEMIGNGLRPPEALRKAQLWLRDLKGEDLEDYLASHPKLRSEFHRRAALRDANALRSESPQLGRRPFRGADCWAPFIAVGA